jgi:hypothetical protein
MADKKLSGCIAGPGPNGEIAIKPIIFLGGTVLSFNASLGVGPTQESTLNVEIINDCDVEALPNDPKGDFFTGQVNLGGPVFFSTHEAVNLPPKAPGTFYFGGILQNYVAQQGSNGLVFNAKVVDPKVLLSNVILAVSNNLIGPIKHRNYYNVYAYYEYNVLPLKLREPQPDQLLLPLSFGTDSPVIPEGNPDGVDCSVFGKAGSDDRGMLAYKIIDALKAMNPLVYSPNYGSTYDPPLTAREVAVAGNRFKHESNVFKLDISELPQPEKYHKIAGPSITLLDFITELCDTYGYEFMVTLEQGNPGQLHTIKVLTKKVQKDEESFRSTIISFNGRSIDLSYGKEMRFDKDRKMLIGEQKHMLYESAHLQHFFGEDSQGKPIIARSDDNFDKCYGFYIDIEVDELSQQLYCPLYDYNTEAPVATGKKFRLYEMDIRLALTDINLWKLRTFNPIFDKDKSHEAFSFNKLIRYNFTIDDVTKDVFQALFKGLKATNEFAKPAKDRAMGDLVGNPNRALVSSVRARRAKDIEVVYNFVRNLGSTYYGKQYLASVALDVCEVVEGFEDDNYFKVKVGGGTIETSKNNGKDTDIILDPCTNEAYNLKQKLWRPLRYSYTPTNEGGWVEPCTPVLGLGIDYDQNGNIISNDNEFKYLDFFTTDDGRVAPFARFDTKDVVLNYTQGWIQNYNPKTFNGFLNEDPCNLNLKSIIAPSGTDGPRVYGVCGELDVSSFNPGDSIILRKFGVCDNPRANPEDKAQEKDDIQPVPEGLVESAVEIYVKAEVEEKIYRLPEPVFVQSIKCSGNRRSDVSPCCGKYQFSDPALDCYIPPPLRDSLPSFLPDDYSENPDICYEFTAVVVTGVAISGTAVPIKFSSPCFKKTCAEDGFDVSNIFRWLQSAVIETVNANEGESPDSDTDHTLKDRPDPNAEDAFRPVDPSHTICLKTIFNRDLTAQNSLDISNFDAKKLCPAADIPTAVVIPLRSNIETYGPWFSKNFEVNAGGIDLQQDADLCPWLLGGEHLMNKIARELVDQQQFNRPEIETGSVNYPYWPESPVGFLKQGPHLTNINVSIGSNGVSTNYVFQSYTPRFGGQGTLEKQHLKETISNRNKLLKINREKQRKIDSLAKKIGSPAQVLQQNAGGTLHRILFGQMYDFNLLTDNEVVVGTGDRTVVGTESLPKSVLELRYDYAKKAFISLDGLYSPVSISGDGGFPRYVVYSGIEDSCKSSPITPNPPIQNSGIDLVNDLDISQYYLNPLTNNFGADEHHHQGDGAGHVVDMVGRESGVPISGLINNFYPQSQWDQRYSDDYRFLGLKGPLVLHAWGYDTQGKPIPNSIDDLELIKNSGIFRTEVEDGEDTIGLQDYFLQDWLHKPSSWPVAPVDLRYDRNRGVWVSPPSHKIVVVKASGNIEPYNTGPGLLVNNKGDNNYGQEIYDKDGNLITADDDDENNSASIIIEDRIGRNISSGEKSYAYFDTFTSTYLLMGAGGSNIKIGKFCNQWPSLPNVKDPKNAVKKVVLYQNPPDACPNEKCPWILEPVMKIVDGIEVPEVVEAINLFANVAAAEYQTKWCAILQIGQYYYLLAAGG